MLRFIQEKQKWRYTHRNHTAVTLVFTKEKVSGMKGLSISGIIW